VQRSDILKRRSESSESPTPANGRAECVGVFVVPWMYHCQVVFPTWHSAAQSVPTQLMIKEMCISSVYGCHANVHVAYLLQASLAPESCRLLSWSPPAWCMIVF